VAGAGAGVLFKLAVGSVAAMAAPAVRGEALAGLFLIAYCGMIIPVVGMGIATEYVAATTAMAWFTGVLVAPLAVIAALHASARRGPQLAAQPSPPAGGR